MDEIIKQNENILNDLLKSIEDLKTIVLEINNNIEKKEENKKEVIEYD